jgi:hypothetical protein
MRFGASSDFILIKYFAAKIQINTFAPLNGLVAQTVRASDS